MISPETTASPADALHILAEELAGEGPVIAPHVAESDAQPALGLLVATGPRCAAQPAEYATLVESVREGYLLHYGEPRLLPALEPDLKLLIGDHLYARGIARLAALDDPSAVAELSDLISLVAQIDASPGHDPMTAEAAWLATAVAIGCGPTEAHELGKQRLRSAGDARPLWKATAEAAAGAGIADRLTKAADAVAFSPSSLG